MIRRLKNKNPIDDYLIIKCIDIEFLQTLRLFLKIVLKKRERFIVGRFGERDINFFKIRFFCNRDHLIIFLC